MEELEAFAINETIDRVLKKRRIEDEAKIRRLASVFVEFKATLEEAIDEIQRDGQKMKEELKKARQMISSGMDQVKQLKQMVTETKQSLQDQKRLQYLENLYRDKILQDELNEELLKEQDVYNDRAQSKKDMNKLSFKDNKRRLQSAYKAGVGGKAAVSSLKGRFNFGER